ncbi:MULTISPECIES: hypothetical protein [unclassified Saccharothrix]|uniref:hypothetical protein n=1 Tax=unclassified Saccharothrix TaxID=2593673 RepID=UPI00307DCE0B
MNKGFQVHGGNVTIGTAVVGDDAHAEVEEIHIGSPSDVATATGSPGSSTNDLSGTAGSVVQARNVGTVTVHSPPGEQA